MRQGKANWVLPRECPGQSKHPLPTTQGKILHMDITRWPTPKSDWLYSLQPKMEKLYSQQKQNWEWTVAQIMNSLLPNSDLNWRKWGKPLDHSGISISISSIAQSCLTVCDPMDCRTPGLSVQHQLLEFTQTYVHWVGDAIQPSHPLSTPFPPAFNLSQHQGLFK